jgi:hypothetical protein
MTSTHCRHHLGEFVDDELVGADRVLVARHLETCAECAGEAEALRSMGRTLRTAASYLPVSVELDGLAGGVISRTRAEEAQSWPAMFGRAFGDWHWVLAVAGSIAAAFVSTALVSLLVQFGPAPERGDSLAGVISHLPGTPAGSLYVWAMPSGDGQSPIIMQVEGGGGLADGVPSEATPVMLGLRTEGDLIGALSDILSRQGPPFDLQALPAGEQVYAQALLDGLRRMHSTNTSFDSTPPVAVYEIRLVASPTAGLKGL